MKLLLILLLCLASCRKMDIQPTQVKQSENYSFGNPSDWWDEPFIDEASGLVRINEKISINPITWEIIKHDPLDTTFYWIDF